ncbi:unnamed protein product [Amoebophrya sp. A25]|nr:unnamed protein product [Amoebophrya sp. A25]|eukprot:GSA25T00018960001.1
MEDFLSFLRIRSVSQEGPTTGAYREAVQFLRALVERRLRPLRSDLEIYEEEFVASKPVLLVHIPSRQDATQPVDPDSTPNYTDAILLNSHYDVVPAMREHWSTDPFAPEMRKDRIYARGTQDMKCVCIQYVLALERALSKTPSFRRPVWLSFVPDEEIGGKDGMCAMLNSALWRDRLEGRVALALDEGLANESEKNFTVFFGERNPWWIMVRAEGPTGHGSRFIQDTAVSKIIKVANKALEFRRAEEERLLYHKNATAFMNSGEAEQPACGCKHSLAKKLGDVTTVNLTALQAGVFNETTKTYALNVIPVEATAGFDVRISPLFKVADFRALLDSWVAEFNGSVTWSFAPGTVPSEKHFLTPVRSRPEYFVCDPVTDILTGESGERNVKSSTAWWDLFAEAMQEFGYGLDAEVFPAATDSRFLRQLKIPAFGFSPMRNCAIMLHEHNEYIPVETFWEGVDVYEKLLPRLFASTI